MAENSADLPEDLIIDEILLRLPVESIGRCRCVSKPWRRSLSSPRFVKAHLERHVDNPPSILFKGFSDYPFHVTTLSRSGGDNNAVSRRVNFSFDEAGLRLNGDSCHGLVLFSRVSNRHDLKMILVNPITLEAREIPNQPIGGYTKWGFGYDSFGDDYKIVGLDDYARVHIYSLKTEIWRSVVNSPYANYFHGEDSGMFVNGCIHWTAAKRNSNGLPSDRVIAAFDLAREEFEQVPFPVDVSRRIWQLTVLDGCLAIAVDGASGSLDLWVMKEYGDSWVKFVIHNRGKFWVNFSIHNGYYPIGVICLIGEDEILVTDKRKLAIYHLRNRDWKDLAIAGITFPFLTMVKLRASLLSPNHVLKHR